MRTAVIVFYFFTFFHKLNADFLDPATSFAVPFFEQTMALLALPVLPGMGQTAILATLLIEGLLVLGLTIPRAWGAACVLGAGFHLLLALDAPQVFYNFSAVMFALLWVFVPRSVAAAVRGRGWDVGQYGFLGGYAAVVLCWWRPDLSWPLTAYGFTALWLAGAGLLVGRVCLAGRPRALGRVRAKTPLARAVLLVLPALVFVNGTTPYLGYKLRSAWQMYSNLNVSAHGSNHYLVPYSLDVGGYLADSAWIAATSDLDLARSYVRTGARMTWVELSYYLAQRPDTRIMYVRAGRSPIFQGWADQEPPFTSGPPWLLRKLFLFRPLGPPAAGLCDW